MFQFTHPGRGATVSYNLSTEVLIVSIHAPREGCDLGWYACTVSCACFNSRTPGGVRLIAGINKMLEMDVSIHAPREGCDCGRLLSYIYTSLFQFTHPGRGATARTWHRSALTSSFQFTHPGRGAT